MSYTTQIKRTRTNPIKKIIMFLALIMSAIIFFAIAVFVAYAIQINNEMSEYDESKIFNLAQNSKIYAADGKTVLAELQIENRIPVNSLDEISPYVKEATISIEDARFYQHNGVDLLGLIRAASVIVGGGNTQGGSTITMQLVRNTILSSQAQSITLKRKLSEIILANKVEQMYTKDQILLMYLNTINYGDRCYGIKAASLHYFSCNPDQLNLEQSATLAGIPQSPTYLCPLNNTEACKNRRNTVLYRMYDDHIISKEAFNEASSKPIELNVSYTDPVSNYKYPYFTNYVREQILEQYTPSQIFEGGFQIYTTLDIEHQEACEAGCQKSNKQLEKGAESVAVTMNPKNGYITGMVGGDDYSVHQYNIATSKGRPTGSSFKAFTLACAIEQGYNPNSYVLDCTSPMKFGDITVQNINGIDYGYKTIQGAIAVSSNTGFVRLQQKLETNNVIDMAKRLGIKNADLPNAATLTLGTADINPIEMASAFSTFASGGIYHEPVTILKIETANGDQIYSYDPHENPDNEKRVIDEKVAGAVTKALKTVFTQGTATSAQLNNRQPVAGKTGTSDNYRDHTLIGYTPSVVLATWIGKRDYAPTSSNVTCNYLWKTIMDQITKNKEIEEFDKVSDPLYSKKSEIIEEKMQDSQLEDAPSVIGMSIQEAKSALSTYNLTVYYSYSDTLPNGIVYSQSIENGRIVLQVSKGKKP